MLLGLPFPVDVSLTVTIGKIQLFESPKLTLRFEEIRLVILVKETPVSLLPFGKESWVEVELNLVARL